MDRPGQPEHIDHGDGSEYYSESSEIPPPGRSGAPQGIGESVRQSRASSTRAARAQQSHTPTPRNNRGEARTAWPEPPVARPGDPIMRDPNTNEEIFEQNGPGHPFLDTHTGETPRPTMTPHPTVHSVTEHHDQQRTPRPRTPEDSRRPSAAESHPNFDEALDGGRYPTPRPYPADEYPSGARPADDYEDVRRHHAARTPRQPAADDVYDYDEASTSHSREPRVYDLREETHTYQQSTARPADRRPARDDYMPPQGRPERGPERSPEPETSGHPRRGRFYDPYYETAESDRDYNRSEVGAEKRTPAYAGGVDAPADPYYDRRPTRDSSSHRDGYGEAPKADVRHPDDHYPAYPDEPLADVDVDVPLDRHSTPEPSQPSEEGRLGKKKSKFPRPRLKARTAEQTRTAEQIDDDYSEPVEHTAQPVAEVVPEPVDPLVRVAELKLQDRQNLATQAIYRLIIAGTVAVCAMLIGLFLIMTKLTIPGLVFAVIGGAVFLWELSSHGRIRARRKARTDNDE